MYSLTHVEVRAKRMLQKMLLFQVRMRFSVPQSILTRSVMLRVLEYFKGILIMTTNRVMMFDVAMLSRCHYAIDFKSLTQKQEKKIWQSYVDQLNQDNCGNKGSIEEWVLQTTRKRTKLSGREIRNVFTTAQTLAMAEPTKKMTRKHLEHVYERLTEFLDAMNETKIHAQSSLNTNAPAG